MKNKPASRHLKSSTLGFILVAATGVLCALGSGLEPGSVSGSALADAPIVQPEANSLVQPGQFSESSPSPPRGDRFNNGQRAAASGSTVSLNGSVSRLHVDSDSRQSSPLRANSTIINTAEAGARKPRMSSVPPAMFKIWLDQAHPEFALKASSLAPQSVVVIKGHYDDSCKTLQKLQIPYTRLSAGELKEYPLDSTRVLIVDCPGDLSRQACQRVRDFVAQGGYLLSTDWALNNFLSNTFDQYVVWNNGTNRDTMYDASVVDQDPTLFSHAVSNAYWKLDPECHLIRVVNKDVVRVLVTSDKLRNDDPDQKGILAVEFPFGRGYVLHIAGHFDNNSAIPFSNFLPDPAPVIGISLRQALAANFVVAGLSNMRIANRYGR